MGNPSTPSTSTGSLFPFDILAEILQLAEFDTLKAMYCLCRKVNREADKLLWTNVTFNLIHWPPMDLDIGPILAIISERVEFQEESCSQLLRTPTL